MDDLTIAGVCCSCLAIFLGGLVIGLYLYFFKPMKTYLLISTLYVAIAVILEGATNIAAAVMGSNMDKVSCYVNLIFRLIGEYFISFWCGSISIMFIVALHTVSTTVGNGVSRTEKLTFYITMIITTIASIAFPIILLCCGFFFYVEGDNLNQLFGERCWIGCEKDIFSYRNTDDEKYMVPLLDRASFYFLDIPMVVCMGIALAGIIYAIVISILSKCPKYQNISSPTKQYYIMLGSTLGLYVLGQMPLIVSNLTSSLEMIVNEDSMRYILFLPLINSIIPIPIWICTTYAFFKMSNNGDDILNNVNQYAKLLENRTSDELLYSSSSEESYS